MESLPDAIQCFWLRIAPAPVSIKKLLHFEVGPMYTMKSQSVWLACRYNLYIQSK